MPKVKPLKIKKGVPFTMRPDDNATYYEWFSRVNSLLIKFRGLDLRDLPDQDYVTWYMERLRPIRAANRIIASINKG